jgi:hypothetical protein
LTDRYDVLAARTYVDSNGEERSAFTRIGTAWRMKERDGYSITLEALPLPSLKDGKLETRILMMPPKPREDSEPAPARQPARQAARVDEDIPF